MHEFHGCLVLINPGVVTAVVPVWPQNFCKAWLKKKKRKGAHCSKYNKGKTESHDIPSKRNISAFIISVGPFEESSRKNTLNVLPYNFHFIIT